MPPASDACCLHSSSQSPFLHEARLREYRPPHTDLPGRRVEDGIQPSSCECLVMPFGSLNAPAGFQALVNDILQDMQVPVCES